MRALCDTASGPRRRGSGPRPGATSRPSRACGPIPLSPALSAACGRPYGHATAARPVRVRSASSSRSICASDAMTWKKKRPAGVVSIPSVGLRNWTRWRPCSRPASSPSSQVQLPDQHVAAQVDIAAGWAGLIGEDTFAPGFLQGVELEVERLLVGRDPGVTDPHAAPPVIFLETHRTRTLARGRFREWFPRSGMPRLGIVAP